MQTPHNSAQKPLFSLNPYLSELCQVIITQVRQHNVYIVDLSVYLSGATFLIRFGSVKAIIKNKPKQKYIHKMNI